MNYTKTVSKELSPRQREELLGVLKYRFEKNMNRHKGLDWTKVKARLEAKADKLCSLAEMERTGGEPDVVGLDKKSGDFVFFDCSAETPKGRTSVCYDREGLESGRASNFLAEQVIFCKRGECQAEGGMDGCILR